MAGGETESKTETFLENLSENPVTTRWSQRGWGFIVLAAAFLAAFLLDGTESSFGILMPYLVKDLDTDVALTSFSGGLITGTALGIGPVVSRLIEKFGCRLVAFAGGVICFLSMLLSTMSVNIAMFIVFYGVCSGIGVGMAYMSYITVVNMYFDKRRSFALGFVTSGSGLGLLSMALLINFLISHYGWRGSYLIVAAIWANLCVIALTMRPLKSLDTMQEKNISEIDEDKPGLLPKSSEAQQNSFDLLSSTLNHATSREDSKRQSWTSATDSGVLHDSDDETLNCLPFNQDIHDHNPSHDSLAPTNILLSTSTYSLKADSHDQTGKDPSQILEEASFGKSLSATNILLKKDFINVPSECISSSVISLASITSRRSKDMPSMPNVGVSKTEKAKEKMTSQLHNQTTYNSLLKNPVFLLFCYGAFSFQLAFNIGPMFLPSYGLHLGLTADQASFTVSVVGICNMIGRFLTGLLSYLGFGNVRVYIGGTLLAGLVCFFISLCTSYVSLIIFAACYGLFLGVFFPLQSVILVEILGIDQLPKSFGIICFCKSITCMLGPYLAGSLYEMTQDYTVPFLFAGCVNIFASFIQLIMARLRKPCREH